MVLHKCVTCGEKLHPGKKVIFPTKENELKATLVIYTIYPCDCTIIKAEVKNDTK